MRETHVDQSLRRTHELSVRRQDRVRELGRVAGEEGPEESVREVVLVGVQVTDHETEPTRVQVAGTAGVDHHVRVADRRPAHGRPGARLVQEPVDHARVEDLSRGERVQVENGAEALVGAQRAAADLVRDRLQTRRVVQECADVRLDAHAGRGEGVVEPRGEGGDLGLVGQVRPGHEQLEDRLQGVLEQRVGPSAGPELLERSDALLVHEAAVAVEGRRPSRSSDLTDDRPHCVVHRRQRRVVVRCGAYAEGTHRRAALVQQARRRMVGWYRCEQVGERVGLAVGHVRPDLERAIAVERVQVRPADTSPTRHALDVADRHLPRVPRTLQQVDQQGVLSAGQVQRCDGRDVVQSARAAGVVQLHHPRAHRVVAGRQVGRTDDGGRDADRQVGAEGGVVAERLADLVRRSTRQEREAVAFSRETQPGGATVHAPRGEGPVVARRVVLGAAALQVQGEGVDVPSIPSSEVVRGRPVEPRPESGPEVLVRQHHRGTQQGVVGELPVQT